NRKIYPREHNPLSIAAEFGISLFCHFGQCLVRSFVPIFGIRREANQNFLAVHFRRAGNSLEKSLGQSLQDEIVSASFGKEPIVPGNDYYSGRKRSSNSAKQPLHGCPALLGGQIIDLCGAGRVEKSLDANIIS